MRVARVLLAGLIAALAGAAAVAADAPLPALDLLESVERLVLTARDRDGASRSVETEMTLYRPRGAGPFPLALLNHGRGSRDQRRQQGRARFEALARYLVNKGFVVALPTRIGYGATFGDFDPEAVGPCRDPRFEVLADASADQALQVVEHLRARPGIDTSRWLVLGQSVGGVAALAVAARQPAGLVAAINFSGGAGGNPDRSPGLPCAPDRLTALWSARAGDATVPTLWLYWRNDRYWGEEVPRQWARAWRDGGGRVELHQLPDAGQDGHGGLSGDMDHWVPLVEPWLNALGLGRPHPPWPAAASGHARVDEVDKLPAPAAVIEGPYRRFLAAAPPRAFAIGPGSWGWSRGDWAPGRALGHCQRRRGQPCTLYAIDDRVVWPATPDAPK